MITLSSHQPAYLPWLGYFNKMAHADVFVILDNVQFEKGSFINRNRIQTPSGPTWMTVPINLRGHMEKSIKQIRVDNSNWPKKHLKSIQANYSKASYFYEYNNFLIKQIYDSTDYYNPFIDNPSGFFPVISVAKLCLANLRSFVALLKIWTKIDSQKHNSYKQQLIIDICKYFKADRFIFGEQGRGYCDIAAFERAGIEPLFQDFRCLEYPQLWGGEFVPRLSVIDALMNIGAKRTRELIMEGWKP